jgi:hypothetical protein
MTDPGAITPAAVTMMIAARESSSGTVCVHRHRGEALRLAALSGPDARVRWATSAIRNAATTRGLTECSLSASFASDCSRTVRHTGFEILVAARVLTSRITRARGFI